MKPDIKKYFLIVLFVFFPGAIFASGDGAADGNRSWHTGPSIPFLSEFSSRVYVSAAVPAEKKIPVSPSTAWEMQEEDAILPSLPGDWTPPPPQTLHADDPPGESPFSAMLVSGGAGIGAGSGSCGGPREIPLNRNSSSGAGATKADLQRSLSHRSVFSRDLLSYAYHSIRQGYGAGEESGLKYITDYEMRRAFARVAGALFLSEQLMRSRGRSSRG